MLGAGRPLADSSDVLSAALVQKPEGSAIWNGPYLKANAVPNDPWGRPYVYRAPGQHGAYDIVSLGPDGHEEDPSITASAPAARP
jgi:general secretion pathway protein G